METTTIIFFRLQEFFLVLLDSKVMTGVKIFLALYLAVVLVDVVLLILNRGIGGDYRLMKKGRNVPSISQRAMLKRWEKIKERLRGENPSQYKVAILEADKIADEILAGIGYKGNNMNERLEQVKPDHMENLGELKKAHQIRNRIVYESDFQLDRKVAEETLEIYENMLKALEYLP
jgi:hypothetical protein